MKKIVMSVLAALCLCGCTKLSKGTYFASLDGKVLNVELLANDKCILSFTGQDSEDTGSYSIDGDTIWLSASVQYGKIGDRDFRFYQFDKGGMGKIGKGSFSVSCSELMTKKTFTCNFSIR